MNPYLELTSLYGFTHDGHLLLREASEVFRESIEPKLTRTTLPKYDRDRELSSFYRELRMQQHSGHLKAVRDPFCIPATFSRGSFSLELYSLFPILYLLIYPCTSICYSR